ncbi:S1/P1 nuclease [Persicobacter sp. CCB-QB2]|uniref:S1/P1 nuclease n=1 Tax=Persicobacter sp. CCB-QB2 TaxID=1561025 RepID=UPI0006A985F3|nr:S1/P1 nuclease [Persicobacter sp. CCB-QB2]
MKKINLVVLMMVALVGQSFGWGANGHRAVGEIAEQHLSSKARKAILALMGDENLAMASTWADEVKSDHAYDSCNVYHYVNMKGDETYERSTKNPEGDAVMALELMSSILKDPNATIEKKREAFRYIVHIVGDLHQPMHVGHAEDLGGNIVKVKWFRKDSNLHRVWDSDIINYLDLSYTELARHVGIPKEAEVKEWQSAKVLDWVEESHLIANELYDNVGDGNFGYRYVYDYKDVMYHQILKGGVRLAGYLNELFG